MVWSRAGGDGSFKVKVLWKSREGNLSLPYSLLWGLEDQEGSMEEVVWG